MSSLYRKKLDKIYNKIDKIAKKGKDNKIEYFKYIDELISKDDYSYYEDVLDIYYDYRIKDDKDFKMNRERAWKLICEKTKSSFLSKLSDLYKSLGVYQMGNSIYLYLTGDILGSIEEIKFVNSNDSSYYIKNEKYSRLLSHIEIHLSVNRLSDGNTLLVDESNINKSLEDDLILKYKKAIEFILE